MRKQDFLLLLAFIATGIGFIKCSVGNVGNVNTYQFTLAVVDHNKNPGRTTIGTEHGFFAAPSLKGQYSYPDDCIFIKEFTVDLDNQPSSQYYTATNVVVDGIVDQLPLEIDDKIGIGGYTLPISDLAVRTHICYNGKLFIFAQSKDKNPEFRLVFDSTAVETNGIKNLYLLAKQADSASSESISIHAFDLLNLFQKYQRDTTIVVSSTSEILDLKYVKANLNYFSEFPTEGDPVKKTTGQFDIYIFE